MMDGSLKEDGKTPADFDYNVSVTRSRETGPRRRRLRRRRTRLPRLARTGMGEKEDGHGAEGKLSHDQLLTDPDEAERVRRRNGRRCARRRDRHQPRRLQVHPQAGRRSAGDGSHRGNSPKLPNCHLVMHGSSQRAAGPAGHHQQIRRQDEANLGRAGRGNPARHQARRPQDQRRHRQPHGDHRAIRKVLRKTRKSSTRATT